MALYSAVSGLILVNSCGAYQDRGHHGQRAETGGHHIAHDIAVIIFESPQEAAFGAHDTGDSVIDQSVEELKACRLKFLLVFILVDLLKDLFEIAVVDLGDGILC